MTNERIRTDKVRLDALYERGQSIADEEALSHWAKYLCVLTSGFLENAICALVNSYVQHYSNSYISGFVAKQLETFYNPKFKKVTALLESFSIEWSEFIKGKATDIQKEALSSIVQNRNVISHGDNSDITFLRLKIWYDRAYELLDLLESKCFCVPESRLAKYAAGEDSAQTPSQDGVDT